MSPPSRMKNIKRIKDLNRNDSSKIIKDLKKRNKKIAKDKTSTQDKEAVFILSPKNEKIFTNYFNISDLKKIFLFFTFDFRRKIEDDNKSIVYINKFNKKIKNNFIKIPANNINKNNFLKKTGWLSTNVNNKNKIKKLDEDIFLSISGYDKNDDDADFEKALDIDLKKLYEKIQSRIESDKHIDIFKDKSNFNIIDNYLPKNYFINMISFLEHAKHKDNGYNYEYNIVIPDAINIMSTSTELFKNNILSSELELGNKTFDKDSMYYNLHLKDYEIKLKDHYFLEYSRLFSIKLDKSTAEKLFKYDNVNFVEELNLSKEDCFLPIFSKSFNPKFNKIPTIIKYDFSIESTNVKEQNLRLEFDTSNYIPKRPANTFVDNEEYNKKFTQTFNNGSVKFTREYVNKEGCDFIIITFEGLDKETADIMYGNFKNIKINSFFEKTFKLTTKSFSLKEEVEFNVEGASLNNKHPEYSFALRHKNNIKLCIPAVQLLKEFWQNLYQIETK